MKKYKLKTHQGTAKRIRVTGSGNEIRPFQSCKQPFASAQVEPHSAIVG